MYFYFYYMSAVATTVLVMNLLYVLHLIIKKIRSNSMVKNKLKRQLYVILCSLVIGFDSLYIGYTHVNDEIEFTTLAVFIGIAVPLLSVCVMIKSAMCLFPLENVTVGKEGLLGRVEEGLKTKQEEEDDDDIFIF